MAYNPYYPYTPYQFPNTPPVMPQTAPQPDKTNGFINVRTVEEAKNYPVAPGNSITFKVENSPYLCTKTMGFSQLDQPHFERYRLVKEEETEVIENTQINPDYALKSDIEDINKRLSEVEMSIKAPKKKGAKLLEESEGNEA